MALTKKVALVIGNQDNALAPVFKESKMAEFTIRTDGHSILTAALIDAVEKSEYRIGVDQKVWMKEKPDTITGIEFNSVSHSIYVHRHERTGKIENSSNIVSFEKGIKMLTIDEEITIDVGEAREKTVTIGNKKDGNGISIGCVLLEPADIDKIIEHQKVIMDVIEINGYDLSFHTNGNISYNGRIISKTLIDKIVKKYNNS